MYNQRFGRNHFQHHRNRGRERFNHHREYEQHVDTSILKFTKLHENKKSMEGARREANIVLNLATLKEADEKNFLNHYIVKFKPEIPKGNPYIKKLLWNIAKRKYWGPDEKITVFDGSNLFITERIPNGGFKFEIELKSKTYQIEVTEEQRKNIAIDKEKKQRQFQNIVLRSGIKQLDHLEIQRNHYDPHNSLSFPNKDITVLKGFFLATYKAMISGLMMKQDIKYKALHNNTVLDRIKQLQIQYPEKYQVFCSKEFSRKIVYAKYLKDKGKSRGFVHIHSIDWNKNPGYHFEVNGKKTTVMKYMKENYNIELKDTMQPLLKFVPRDFLVTKREFSDKDCHFFVPELVYLTGLGQFEHDQYFFKSFRAKTRLSPSQRIVDIFKNFQAIKENKKSQKIWKEYKIDFDESLQFVQGKVLYSPKLRVGNDTMEKFEKRNLKGRIHKKVDLNDWILVHGPNPRMKEAAGQFIHWFIVHSQRCGIEVKPPKKFVLKSYDPHEYARCFKSVVKKDSTQLVVTFTKGDDPKAYEILKKELILRYKISSQNIQESTVLRSQGAKFNSICFNLMIQIQTKLKGLPWTIDLNRKELPPRTLLCGLDVHHSGFDFETKKKVSVVGMVGSDFGCSEFFSICWAHKSRREISNIGEPFEKIMRAYQSKIGKFPESVVFFRDGIGEGSWQYVKEEEELMRKVFRKLEIKCRLHFVICCKRNNFRMFERLNPSQIINVEKGTVVDHSVVDRNEFLMNSCLTPRGVCSLPMRFNIVANDLELSKSYIEELTYHLTYNYYNWPDAIKQPSLCMYAHKLAFMVGKEMKAEAYALNRLYNSLWYL